jgi:hypothetical protein
VSSSDGDDKEEPTTEAEGASGSGSAEYEELARALEDEDFECLPPISGNTAARIREIYQANRGVELGTVSLAHSSLNTLPEPIG